MSSSDRDPIREAHRQWVAHGWSPAADGMAMVTSVVRVQQLLLERIEAVLRPLDLTFARYEVLRLLSFSSAGAMPMTRMGSLLQVHPTSVTSAVDRLEKQGYVERSRRETDRRVVLATITRPAGRWSRRRPPGSTVGLRVPRALAVRPRRPHPPARRAPRLGRGHRRPGGIVRRPAGTGAAPDVQRPSRTIPPPADGTITRTSKYLRKQAR